MGGPVGMLAAYLGGTPLRGRRVRVGLPLAEVVAGQYEGELAVLELVARAGHGLVHPAPEMALLPTDEPFRRAVNNAAEVASIPRHLDVAWTVRTRARMLTGESVGGAACVAFLAVARKRSLDQPGRGVAGGINPDWTFRSLAAEAPAAYRAKLQMSRWVVVPEVDREPLRSKNLAHPGVRFANRASEALTIVARPRWRPAALAGTAAVACAVAMAALPASQGAPAPTTSTAVAGDAQPESGEITGAVRVPGSSVRAMTMAGDMLAVTDGSSLLLADPSGRNLRSFQLPGVFGAGLGYDGTAFWVASAGELHRFVVEGERPNEWLRPLPAIRWPNSGLGQRDLAFDGSGMWVASGPEVVRVDPGGRETGRVRAAARVVGVAWDGTYLWLAESNGRTVEIRQVTLDGTTVRSLPAPVEGIVSLDWHRGDLLAAIGSLTGDRSWLLLRIAM